MEKRTRQVPPEGVDAAPRATDRLFLAVVPDSRTAARIEDLTQRLRAEHGLKGRSLGIERFHVTLHFVGDFAGPRPDIVDAVREVAASVAQRPLPVALDRVASFSRRGRRAPLVLLGGDGLLALTSFQQVLENTMTSAGLGRASYQGYTPHLTLLYDGLQLAEQAIEPIHWLAREFVLVRSLIGKNQHLPIARFPLRG